MATHSSILAWKISKTEEPWPGGWGVVWRRLARRATVHGSHRRVGHDLATKQQLMISMGWVLREIQKKTHA